ncbi:MAG: hypothetical protein JXA37_04135 [Chloroflexia bacterium]|nr:hypothetical protein [Chloroflexia bacterium]
MEPTTKPLPLIPSLVIVLDKEGEKIAGKVQERIKGNRNLCQRVAFLRYHPAADEIEVTFPTFLGPGTGVEVVERAPVRVEPDDTRDSAGPGETGEEKIEKRGPVSQVIWKVVSRLNQVEPYEERLLQQGYYVQLGSPVIYYLGDFGQVAQLDTTDPTAEEGTAEPEAAEPAESGDIDQGAQSDVMDTTADRNTEAEAVAPGESRSLVNLVQEVQQTLIDRELTNTTRVALFSVVLPSEREKRRDTYQRMAHLALTELLALPAKPVQENVADIRTPPLTFCYLFSDMDERNRTRRKEDVLDCMALVLQLMLTSDLRDNKDKHYEQIYLSHNREFWASNLEDVRQWPRLGSMGVSRFFYPRDEIETYCARRLALEHLLPKLVPPKLPDDPSEYAPRYAKLKEWQEEGKEIGREHLETMLEKTERRSMGNARSGKRRPLFFPRLSMLMHELEADPEQPSRVESNLLKDLETSDYRLLSDPEVWFKRLDEHWVCSGGAEAADDLQHWWEACEERWHSFQEERLTTIREELDEFLSHYFARGSTKAFGALDVLVPRLRQQVEEAENEVSSARDEWVPMLRRLVDRMGRMGRIQRGPGGAPIGSAISGSSMIQSEEQSPPAAPEEDPGLADNTIQGATDQPEGLPAAVIFSDEKAYDQDLTPEAIEAIYEGLRYRVRYLYGRIPKPRAVVSLASLVVPLSYYALRAFLPMASWPWYLQAAIYTIPLGLLLLTWAGIRELARYRLRRAGQELITFVRQTIVRKLEERDLKARVTFFTNMKSRLSEMRDGLRKMLQHLREELPVEWKKLYKKDESWPHQPSPNVPAVLGAKFESKFNYVSGQRIEDAATDEDMVLRFHQQLEEEELSFLNNRPSQIEDELLTFCRQECARYLKNDTLSQFRPSDPVSLHKTLYDQATPLLLSTSPLTTQEWTQRHPLLFAADGLLQHPLVQQAQKEEQISIVRIPDLDHIAVLQYAAGVWPDFLSQVHGSSSEEAPQWPAGSMPEGLQELSTDEFLSSLGVGSEEPAQDSGQATEEADK